MRILFDNFIKGSTLSSSNSDSSTPVNNVSDNTLQTIHKASGASTTITTAFDSDKTISSIAIGNHNISTLTVVFKDSGGGTIDTKNYTSSDFTFTDKYGEVFYIGMVYFTAIPNVRTIEYSFVGTADPFYIGGLSTGQYLEFPYFNINLDMSYKYTGAFNKTTGGVIYGDDGVFLERFDVTFDLLTITQKDTMDYFVKFIKTNTPMYIDRWEESKGDFTTLFCNQTNDNIGYKKVNGRMIFSDLTLNFEECK